MKKTVFGSIIATVVITGSLAFAHCEIPCGIYGDRMRIEQLREHFRTLEKSMKQVVELQKAEDIDYNQLVRWVNNKELHANKVQEIVYQYFMNQRITPVEKGDAEAYEKYVEQLTLLHGMLVHAMKSKQTTDIKHVEELRELVDAFEEAYFEDDEVDDKGKKTGKQDHGHEHGHMPHKR